MYTKIKESIFSDEFVSPDLSATLMHLGITEKVPYKYRMGKDFCFINTYEFDTEGIYRLMDANVEQTKGVCIIPAYRVKDLERVFTGYSLTKKDHDHYQISYTHGLTNYTASSERMPDVFASLIMQLIQGKKISVKEINDLMLVA